jgi:Tfp pilus assembly protein PilN
MPYLEPLWEVKYYMAIKVDLLPTERKKFGFDIVIALMVLLVVGSFVGCYWYTTQKEDYLKNKKEEVSAKQKELDIAKQGTERKGELEKQLKEIDDNIRMVENLQDDPIRYSNLLDELSSLLPNNMWVSSIAIDPQKNTLTLSGVAAEQPGVRPVESISGFMKSVAKSKYFKNAVISSTTRGKTSVAGKDYTSYSWNIELEYDPIKALGRT